MESSSKNNREKELAALSYLWIFSIIIVIAKKESTFIQHHARRGVVLFIASILIWLVPILRFSEFIIFGLMILGFISASMGNQNTIPILSDIADRFFRNQPLNIKPLNSTNNESKLDEQLMKREEKKLSSLYHRLEIDEKKIDELAHKVEQLKKNN